jgi:hypothetical protein
MVKRVSSDARANSAATVKAAARAKAKIVAQNEGGRHANNGLSEKVTFKQLIVGVVILCCAFLLLVASVADIKGLLGFTPTHYEPFLPQNVLVVFEATSKKPVDYEIYYTIERETWYNEDNKVTVKGKPGAHQYVATLPVERIYNIRIDFGENPGAILVTDIRLMGTQAALLDNFENYNYNQIEKHHITPKGQLFFISEEKDPYMIYKDDLPF